MGTKSTPGLDEIARMVGVSKMTVSRVLRGGTGFSAETEARVRAAAERVGYVPNRIAAAFGSAEASTLIGICVPRLSGSLVSRMLDVLADRLLKLGYQTMLGAHQDDREEEALWLRSIAAWRPAAVILVGRSHSPATRSLLKDLTIPVVETWAMPADPLDMAIGVSLEGAGLEMARLVSDAGRRSIGYVGALRDVPCMGELRLDGFVQGLAEAGLRLKATEIVTDQPSFYAGFYGTETLINRTPKLDAIYFHNDEMAIGGMAYLDRRGIKVPDDIGIAGWGGMEAASILPKRLSTSVMPTADLGRITAEVLGSRLSGQAFKDMQLLPTRLVRGATL